MSYYGEGVDVAGKGVRDGVEVSVIEGVMVGRLVLVGV